MSDSDDLVTVGKVTGHYGVRGWLKVFSYTQPMENISNYSTWIVGGEEFKGIKSKRHGKTMVALFKDCHNREASQQYIGAQIEIKRLTMKSLSDGEYYWHQLMGLQVKDTDGQMLGQVDSLFETGANDVLVIKGINDDEFLIPYVQDKYVLSVNLEQNVIEVDWELDVE